ncbi:hypothetical protein ALC62_05098 [Cyphomyrmex costatus]|uniref:Uncharacterized protein n=1 Tax=Cyphomyrmex costatus TaxID=456900 RepID=A0A195CUY4_9HYME|nr:hypothetical protein ALC62_05098 [Cyphomyrmex costatus]
MPFNSRTNIRQADQGPMEIFDETSRKKKQVPRPSKVRYTGSALVSKRFNTPSNTRCREKRTSARAYAREVDERQVRLAVVVFPLTTTVLWYNVHRKARSYVKAVKAISTEARTERNRDQGASTNTTQCVKVVEMSTNGLGQGHHEWQ